MLTAILLALVFNVTPTFGNAPLTVRIECDGVVIDETIHANKVYKCERTSFLIEWEPPTTNEPDEQHPTEWPLTDLTGFKIYWGTNSAQLNNVIDIPDPLLKAHRMFPFELNTTYYFSMTAYNSLRIESRRTKVIWKLT